MRQSKIIKYKNFSIEGCSYRLVASKRWRPKVMLQENRRSEIVETPLLWDRELATKKEADEFALAQAKMFIKRKNTL